MLLLPLATVNASVRESMKDVANYDMHREVRNFVNQKIFERILRQRFSAGTSFSVSVYSIVYLLL